MSIAALPMIAQNPVNESQSAQSTDVPRGSSASLTPEEKYKLADEKFDNEEFTEAFELAKEAAEEGNAAAQNLLGTCYINGLGTPPFPSEGVKWFKTAAENGYANAMYNLGICYEKGIGAMANRDKCAEWMLKGANIGSTKAMNWLGWYYNHYNNVRDDSKAISWYKKAAEKNDPEACGNLGWIYLCNSMGMDEDKARQEAKKWFIKGAELGDESSKTNLKKFFNVDYK